MEATPATTATDTPAITTAEARNPSDDQAADTRQRSAGDERTLTSQGAERKEQLLRSAERLFADHGYAATRILDICSAAGVVKSLFYWYFPTKLDCYADLVRTRRHGLRVAQARAMDRDADPLVQIRQGCEASIHFMAEHASYFMQLDHARDDPEVAAVLDQGGNVFRDDVVALIRRGQESGQILDEDPKRLAVGVISTVATFAGWRRSGRTDADVDDLARFVGDWVVRALAPPP